MRAASLPVSFHLVRTMSCLAIAVISFAAIVTAPPFDAAPPLRALAASTAGNGPVAR